jgi:hypothetical protein
MPKTMMIGQCGPSYSPRYYIQNHEGAYWTGSTWSTDHRKAYLFHRVGEVGESLYELMLSQISGPVSSFVVPLVVQAKSETPFDLDKLKLWLNRAVHVAINAELGTGPVPNSMVMIRLDWDNLKEGES